MVVEYATGSRFEDKDKRNKVQQTVEKNVSSFIFINKWQLSQRQEEPGLVGNMVHKTQVPKLAHSSHT